MVTLWDEKDALQLQSVGPYRLVRLTAPHKNPVHGAIICMVGHIVESDSDVQCYLQKSILRKRRFA